MKSKEEKGFNPTVTAHQRRLETATKRGPQTQCNVHTAFTRWNSSTAFGPQHTSNVRLVKDRPLLFLRVLRVHTRAGDSNVYRSQTL